MGWLDDFRVLPEDVRYFGENLSRPECIIAEPDGTLWISDDRGAVTRIDPDGGQSMLGRIGGAPNGLAMDRAGDFYVANVADGTKMAVMLYIIPFVFFYEPAMLAQKISSPLHMVVVLAETLIASVFVAAATQGFFLVVLKVSERLIFAAVGAALIFHVVLSGEAFLSLYLLAATLLGALAVFWQFVRWRSESAAAAA